MTSKMLVEWQGLFENLEICSAKILRIGHLTGNETGIATVIEAVKQSTFFKRYLNYEGIPIELATEAQNILKLFIANTKFKNKTLLQTQEYSHLLNTLPTLSKCILANIIIQLDLTESFCVLLLDFPVQLTIEMFNEITVYLKFFLPVRRLEYSYTYMRTIIKLVPNLKDEDNLHIIKLMSHFKDFMKNMMPLDNTKDLSDIEETKLLQSYGYTLLYFFRLMQVCSLENDTFLLNLIKACDPVLCEVSLDVYASWEEVLLDDLSLQDAIAIEAYEIKKKLENYEPAKEMLEKICSAKSRDEVIKISMKAADISIIIKNVNTVDQYQKLWFQALLKNENVFNNINSINCLNTWMKMCTREDVSLFMAHPKRDENSANKNLILECIKSLHITDIKLLILEYYQEHDVSDVLFEVDNINEELTPLLNKITTVDEVEENVMKNIYVLLLVNPQLILQTFCNRCLQNTSYITRVASLFHFIKSVPKVFEYFQFTLETALLGNTISATNYTNHTDLINLLVNLNYFSKSGVISKILMPQVESLYQNENDDLLCIVLQLISNLCEDYDEEIPLALIEILIKIIDSSRTSSLNFSFNKQRNLGVAIKLILKLNPKIKSTFRPNFTDTFLKLEKKHELTKYYCALVSGKMEKTFFETYHGSFDVHNIHNMIVPLITILTQSVAEEWLLVINEMQSKLDNKSVIQILTNILQTICENTAITKDILQTNNFKWCLDQYLVIIKEVLKPACSTKDDEYLLIENIIYILAYLHESFRSYGLKFIDLITCEQFRLLKDDEKLVIFLLTFKDKALSEIIAKKIML